MKNEELVLKYLKLVDCIVDKHFKKYHRFKKDIRDDLICEGRLYLIRAAKGYRKYENAKFITYAYTCILRSLYRYISYTNKENRYNVVIIYNYGKKENKDNDNIMDDELIDVLAQKYTLIKYKDEYNKIELIDFIERSNIKDICKIIEEKEKGKTQKEIAKELGISQAAVNARLTKLRKKLENEYIS